MGDDARAGWRGSVLSPVNAIVETKMSGTDIKSISDTVASFSHQQDSGHRFPCIVIEIGHDALHRWKFVLRADANTCYHTSNR
jgi:hypothetical protein